MQLTTNFRLRKPEGTDPVDVQDFNDNADVIDGELAKKLDKTGVGSDLVTAFSQAAGRTNLSSGEKLSTSLGKVMKWFTDLKTVAFSGSYADLSNKPTIPSGAAGTHGVANNCTTTAANYVLDARQGTALQNNINQVNSNLTTNVSAITSTWLGNNKLSFDGSNFWATASNGIKKKLGEPEYTQKTVNVSSTNQESNNFRGNYFKTNIFNKELNSSIFYSVLSMYPYGGGSMTVNTGTATYNPDTGDLYIQSYYCTINSIFVYSTI